MHKSSKINRLSPNISVQMNGKRSMGEVNPMCVSIGQFTQLIQMNRLNPTLATQNTSQLWTTPLSSRNPRPPFAIFPTPNALFIEIVSSSYYKWLLQSYQSYPYENIIRNEIISTTIFSWGTISRGCFRHIVCLKCHIIRNLFIPKMLIRTACF
jgi:hypothetical protein